MPEKENGKTNSSIYYFCNILNAYVIDLLKREKVCANIHVWSLAIVFYLPSENEEIYMRLENEETVEYFQRSNQYHANTALLSSIKFFLVLGHGNSERVNMF